MSLFGCVTGMDEFVFRCDGIDEFVLIYDRNGWEIETRGKVHKLFCTV